MELYDFIIVGAGIYGASMAYLITNKLSPDAKVLIIDKKQKVGGMCADRQENNILVQECGVHVFHTSNKDVWDFVNKFDSWTRYTHCVKAKDSRGRIFSLPFNMNTFYQLWGEDIEGVKSIIEKDIQAWGVDSPKNLEEQALSSVGKTIYDTFIKEYTEKQWKCKCTELDASIIKRIPIRYTFNDDYFNDTYEAMPDNGFSKFIENIIKKSGADVMLNTTFSKEHLPLLKSSGKIIYTGSIDELFNYCYGPLDYRTTRWEYETLNIPNYQGTSVINYTAHLTNGQSTPYTRITEFKFLDPLHRADADNVTIISREYPDEYIIGKEPLYPINNAENITRYENYKSLANDNKQLILGGRLGDYKYYDMDKVIEKAFSDFERLKNEYCNNKAV